MEVWGFEAALTTFSIFALASWRRTEDWNLEFDLHLLARTRRWISTAGIRQKIKKYLTKIWNFDRKSSQWQLYLDGRFWSIFQTVRSLLNQELYAVEMVPRWSSFHGDQRGTFSTAWSSWLRNDLTVSSSSNLTNQVHLRKFAKILIRPTFFDGQIAHLQHLASVPKLFERHPKGLTVYAGGSFG